MESVLNVLELTQQALKLLHILVERVGIRHLREVLVRQHQLQVSRGFGRGGKLVVRDLLTELDSTASCSSIECPDCVSSVCARRSIRAADLDRVINVRLSKIEHDARKRDSLLEDFRNALIIASTQGDLLWWRLMLLAWVIADDKLRSPLGRRCVLVDGAREPSV